MFGSEMATHVCVRCYGRGRLAVVGGAGTVLTGGAAGRCTSSSVGLRYRACMYGSCICAEEIQA